MGQKGDKMNHNSVTSAELLLEKLNSIGGVSAKKMFGGHGIFHNGKMFGIVDSKGKIFMKANEFLKLEFESKGSKKHNKMPYYSIPDSVLNNLDQLLVWAKKSIEISK